MAEVAPVSPESPNLPTLSPTDTVPIPAAATVAPPPKQGRGSTFTDADDIIIIREVAAAKAHLAPFGQVLKRYKDAADLANRNPQLSAKATAKRLQDRYKKLMYAFARTDRKEQQMSGIGGEVRELDELLGRMMEAQEICWEEGGRPCVEAGDGEA
eukprot:IDg2886t1